MEFHQWLQLFLQFVRKGVPLPMLCCMELGIWRCCYNMISNVVVSDLILLLIILIALIIKYFFRLPKFKAEIKCFLSQWIPSCVGNCLLEMKNSPRCPDCLQHLIPSEFTSKETNSVSKERIRRGYYKRGESNPSSNLDFKTLGNDGANLPPAIAIMDKPSGNPKNLLSTHCNQTPNFATL